MTVKENTKVRVKYRPELGAGEVIRICEDHGEYMIDVAFEQEGKRILETFPESMVEPVDDIFQKYEKGVSGKPLNFFLKQLAYQLPNENSGGELSSSKADLLPHQILLTHKVVEARRRRFLIADEVGLGKTIEAGMIMRELLSRKDTDRILIICPAGLTENWRNELKDCFRMYFDIFGTDFTDANAYAWEKHNLVIASIDTIKKPARLEKLMKGPEWGIIVFDEAHHLSRKKYGEKIVVTQNYRLAEKLKGVTRDMLFLSATPHQGDKYQFWSLVQLLDDQLFESPESMIDHRGLLGRVMIRRTKREVTRWALDAQELSDDIIEASANIPHEDQKVKELIGLVDDGPDRKFDTLVRAIEQIRNDNEREKIIIFTQYLETLYFLKEELGKYYNADNIAIIKGGPLKEKIASCESFWNENGAQFLLSTSAGGEGINLQICRVLFNYDLPWNPMAVEQRIGRIHRYGQTDTAQVYNLVAEGTIEENVYSILEQKLFEIAKTIGRI